MIATPPPRYVQVAMRASDGSYPDLRCPRTHPLREAIVSWDGGYALNCPDARYGRQHRCNALLWLLKLTIARPPARGAGLEWEDVWIVAAITRQELEAMRAQRLGVWQQIHYLWGPARVHGPAGGARGQAATLPIPAAIGR